MASKKENIIQFVGFITRLDPGEFLSDWERYSRELVTVPDATVLHLGVGSNSRFKYVSQHEIAEQGLSFAFMKNRTSKYFREQRVKVSEIGGYIPIQVGCSDYDESIDMKVMAFIAHNDTDIDFYRKLVPHSALNIYQEYYENCLYGYVLEFFVREEDASALLEQLKARPGIEASMYKPCVAERI